MESSAQHRGRSGEAEFRTGRCLIREEDMVRNRVEYEKKRREEVLKSDREGLKVTEKKRN